MSNKVLLFVFFIGFCAIQEGACFTEILRNVKAALLNQVQPHQGNYYGRNYYTNQYSASQQTPRLLVDYDGTYDIRSEGRYGDAQVEKDFTKSYYHNLENAGRASLYKDKGAVKSYYLYDIPDGDAVLDEYVKNLENRQEYVNSNFDTKGYVQKLAAGGYTDAQDNLSDDVQNYQVQGLVQKSKYSGGGYGDTLPQNGQYQVQSFVQNSGVQGSVPENVQNYQVHGFVQNSNVQGSLPGNAQSYQAQTFVQDNANFDQNADNYQNIKEAHENLALVQNYANQNLQGYVKNLPVDNYQYVQQEQTQNSQNFQEAQQNLALVQNYANNQGYVQNVNDYSDVHNQGYVQTNLQNVARTPEHLLPATDIEVTQAKLLEYIDNSDVLKYPTGNYAQNFVNQQYKVDNSFANYNRPVVDGAAVKLAHQNSAQNQNYANSYNSFGNVGQKITYNEGTQDLDYKYYVEKTQSPVNVVQEQREYQTNPSYLEKQTGYVSQNYQTHPSFTYTQVYPATNAATTQNQYIGYHHQNNPSGYSFTSAQIYPATAQNQLVHYHHQTNPSYAQGYHNFQNAVNYHNAPTTNFGVTHFLTKDNFNQQYANGYQGYNTQNYHHTLSDAKLLPAADIEVVKAKLVQYDQAPVFSPYHHIVGNYQARNIQEKLENEENKNSVNYHAQVLQTENVGGNQGLNLQTSQQLANTGNQYLNSFQQVQTSQNLNSIPEVNQGQQPYANQQNSNFGYHQYHNGVSIPNYPYHQNQVSSGYVQSYPYQSHYFRYHSVPAWDQYRQYSYNYNPFLYLCCYQTYRGQVEQQQGGNQGYYYPKPNVPFPLPEGGNGPPSEATPEAETYLKSIQNNSSPLNQLFNQQQSGNGVSVRPINTDYAPTIGNIQQNLPATSSNYNTNSNYLNLISQLANNGTNLPGNILSDLVKQNLTSQVEASKTWTLGNPDIEMANRNFSRVPPNLDQSFIRSTPNLPASTGSSSSFSSSSVSGRTSVHSRLPQFGTSGSGSVGPASSSVLGLNTKPTLYNLEGDTK